MYLSTIVLVIGGIVLLYMSIKLFLAALLVYFVYYILKKKELFSLSPSIRFLSKQECQALMKDDKDDFIKSMSDIDIHARNASSKDEYTQKAINACKDFTSYDKSRIQSLMASIKPVDLAPFGIDNAKWNNLRLNIAFSYYEEEYPHTRGDTIILNTRTMSRTDADLINTIIHEKVHIYQKTYPQETEDYLRSIGFTKMVPISKYPLGRLNPDTDRMVYKDSTGRIYIGEYNSAQPSGLWDINTSAEAEHPWEIMAYKIADMHRS